MERLSVGLAARALEVLRGRSRPPYTSSLLAADEVDIVADVARIGRDEAGRLIGSQRPEKREHVDGIQEYWTPRSPLFPNGLILALPSEMGRESSRGPTTTDGLAVSGALECPDRRWDDRPGLRRSSTGGNGD